MRQRKTGRAFYAECLRNSCGRNHGFLAILVTVCAALIAGCAGKQQVVQSAPTECPPETGQAQQTAEKPKSDTSEMMAKKKQSGHYSIRDWWPNQLDLRVLHQNAPESNPMGADFNYAEAFSKLDLAAVKQDIKTLLTNSREWWPADWGHYGGLMIRLAWHSSGTYRVTDGRGGSASGTIRFPPLGSWPDNANLDKARRLLWPVKKKYGNSLSWADLMVLAGNVSLESMGFKTFGFGGGREDVYEPDDFNWGPETEWLADERFTKDGKDLKGAVGATQMGLIYVNPEGPGGKPDPVAAAHHIRIAFARMAMNDEETVALIAGGHTLGKSHGAHKPTKCVGPEPAAAGVEEQGLGWMNKCGSGKGVDTVTSGIEGAWTSTPIRWSHEYLENLFKYEWKLIEGPGGAHQWEPIGLNPTVPDAHDPSKRHLPMMLTTDLSLVQDPEYRKISQRFHDDPQLFEQAFAKAWFKLTHRDMGPHSRLLGTEVPEPQLWQDPVPKVDHKLVGKREIAALKKKILASGLTIGQLVSTAWASASTYRDTDKRGGANGARIRLAPQKDWRVNQPDELAKVLEKLTKIQSDFNSTAKKGIKISLADLIVLGGSAAIEAAAKKAGIQVIVPFTPGRTDATQEMTDADSFSVLEPKADGFRNYLCPKNDGIPPELLVDRASLLKLTAPEMTVLVGGMRVLDTNVGSNNHGIFTKQPGVLTNDFFINLIDDMTVKWEKTQHPHIYQAKNRKTGKKIWTATDVDLIFGSNEQLRAIAEVYAGDDAKEKFVTDFIAAWVKVMNLDRFDLEVTRDQGSRQ